jgi:hypothetical protein
MSVTFTIATSGEAADEINVSNVNGRELLRVLNVPGADHADLCGSIVASDLARLCMAFINSTAGDPERAAHEPLQDSSRARLVECGRAEGYLRARALELWRLCLSAPPESEISWG